VVCQSGTFGRFGVKPHTHRLFASGLLGDLSGVVHKAGVPMRLGKTDLREQPVPPELDYDTWLGQAPWAPYHKERCHYNFRFVSDYSGGDMTNWGAHHLDITQWALDADASGPLEVEGRGKRNPTGLHDAFYDAEVDYLYPGGVKVELRSGGKEVGTGGVRFEGTDGWVEVSRERLRAEPRSLLTTRIGPDEIHLGPKGTGGTHMGIWLDCIRKRSPRGLNVPVEVGHRSATVCHLGNIAMELGRKLKWDAAKEQVLDDDEANRMVQRTMREPWSL